MKTVSQILFSVLLVMNAYTLDVFASPQESAASSAVERLQSLLGASKRTLTYRIDHWFEADEIYQLEYVPTKDGVTLTFIQNLQQKNSYFISANINQSAHLGSTWIKTGVDTYDWSQLYKIENNLGIIITQNNDNPNYVGFYIVRGKNGGVLARLPSVEQTFFDLEKRYDLLQLHEQNLNDQR